MKKFKLAITYIIIALVYFVVLAEIIFRHLSEETYLFVAKISNPLNIMSSSFDSLILLMLFFSMLLSWLSIVFFKSSCKGKKQSIF
ncbi:hypothetical protein EDC48_10344 [Gibbsiella quercinecans]|uniref:Uncharacterized protein n=1 Tax=Gibbsiella quercinecans TaxID=929813 RepID=A0A250AX52_9GAMM|nr:hypothetical protein AWC35_02340 [Gibbsiella quercinecans]RLM13006.1 hypothetical protein BIY31_01130 [Gibbsiella quercinecans]RLM14508.1 hypothetical protein BIY30_03050 [Gibbsiella quercinecans]TCT90860.1 hypothetical protein EDC48_10344 [Gibbsiella quercinecans]